MTAIPLAVLACGNQGEPDQNASSTDQSNQYEPNTSDEETIPINAENVLGTWEVTSHSYSDDAIIGTFYTFETDTMRFSMFEEGQLISYNCFWEFSEDDQEIKATIEEETTTKWVRFDGNIIDGKLYLNSSRGFTLVLEKR